MGYHITIFEHDVIIPTDRMASALHELKAMAMNKDKMGGGGFTGVGEPVEQWFSWVDMQQLANAETLVEAFNAWRYDFVNSDDGVVLENFEGEKLGDDAFLWETLAPFIKDGGFMEVHGEDNDYWRWKFNDGKFREVELQLTEVPYQRV